MARKKKPILNQVVDKPIVEVKAEGKVFDSLQSFYNTDVVEELEKAVEKELNPESDMISLKDSGEKLAELKGKENITPEDSEEDVEEEFIAAVPRPAGVRSLTKDVRNSLSRNELRLFERTGKLPN